MTEYLMGLEVRGNFVGIVWELFGNFVVLSFPDYQLVKSFFGKFVGIVWELFGNFVGIWEGIWEGFEREFERECFIVLKGSEKKIKKI